MNQHQTIQRQLAFSVIVAGKNARFAEEATWRLFPKLWMDPFRWVKSWLRVNGKLERQLRKARTGNYTKLVRCFTELVRADLDLATCSVADLEAIHGIGPKTARFFILWTRPEARCAALDVHILRWLGRQGYQVPKSTPPAGPAYNRLEEAFLRESDKRGMTPAELDAQIWVEASGFGRWNPDFSLGHPEHVKNGELRGNI